MKDRLARLRRHARAIAGAFALVLAAVAAVIVISSRPAHAQPSAGANVGSSGAPAASSGGPGAANVVGHHARARRRPVTTGGSAPGRPGTPATAPSGRSVAQALEQATGLSPTQVTARAICPPVAKGHARCAGEALVLRSTGKPVHPHVGAQQALGRVKPRRVTPGVRSASAPSSSPPQSATPAYLEQAYDLSYLSQTGGTGDTVAIVDAYDDPTAETDLGVYRSTYGLPACTTNNGCFEKVNESGAVSPLPPADDAWDQETSLDLDAVSAICPNCHILLVEATSDQPGDMNNAVSTAAALGADQISASWTMQSTTTPGTYTFPGVATVAATGDMGYVPGPLNNYPAAVPGVTAAGGTTLTPASTATSARGFSEGAWSWNGTSGGGSGCAGNFTRPTYQPNEGCTGRAYADLSADANPSTGLNVYDNGSWALFGGTSLSTPLIAAYYAITDVAAGTPKWAYDDSAQLNDITTGSSGTCSITISYICTAGPGYDGPTGVGSISGAAVSGAPGIGGPAISSGSGNTYTQSVGSHSAAVAGGIYRNGLDTTWWIEYGTTSAYGSQTASVNIGAGSTPVAVTGYLSQLAPATTYHYRLVAQNNLGTTYGYDYTFTTAAAPPTVPTASFDVSPGTPAPGTPATFDASASTPGSGPAITDYSWNFGDGTGTQDAGTSAVFSHTYAARGSYTVTLTVTNAAGSDTSTQIVTVDDPPTAAFTPSPSLATPGSTISFDASASAPGDPGGTITDYSWHFGDGTPVVDSGATAVVTHAYAIPGNYTVMLTTTDDLGVTSTTTQQITVDTPAAAFTASPTLAAPGATISFDASGSHDPVGTITDYRWDFGDGTGVPDQGTVPTVEHTFAARGKYTVTLTVTNNYGQTATTTQTVTLDDPPTAAFTPSPTVAAPGANVSFDASASAPGAAGGTIADYSWNFGDGTPVDDAGSSTSASHAFASPGVYTVTLTTTDDLGVTSTATQQVTVDAPDAAFTASPSVIAPGGTVSLDASGSTDPEGTITDYSWNFGDGTGNQDAGTSAAVQHTYASRGRYTVTLTVTNNYDQTGIATRTVTVDDPPTAAFTPSPTVAAPGANVSFDASASAPGDPSGTIADYSWNFGDGTPVDDAGSSTGASHAFASRGVYTVTLTTTDDLGVTSTATHQVTVDAPAASFTFSPATPVPGAPVSLDASGSTDPEGTITDYSWNFGDGTGNQDAGTSAAVQHTYASRGRYTITLTVTNNYSQTATATKTVTVDDPPTAAFIPSTTVATPGSAVSFDASGSVAPGGTITDYSWNFGDGTPVDDAGTSAHTSHAFASPGVYTVTLTTTDDLGLTQSASRQITVQAPVSPPARTALPPSTTPTPAPAPPPASPAAAPAQSPLTSALTIDKKQRLAAVLAHGLRLQLSVNASATISFQITIPVAETRQGAKARGATGRKPARVVLLRTPARSVGSGSYAITLKLSKAAIHDLSAAGPLVLTVRVTVTGASGTKLTRSGTVKPQR